METFTVERKKVLVALCICCTLCLVRQKEERQSSRKTGSAVCLMLILEKSRAGMNLNNPIAKARPACVVAQCTPRIGAWSPNREYSWRWLRRSH